MPKLTAPCSLSMFCCKSKTKQKRPLTFQAFHFSRQDSCENVISIQHGWGSDGIGQVAEVREVAGEEEFFPFPVQGAEGVVGRVGGVVVLAGHACHKPTQQWNESVKKAYKSKAMEQRDFRAGTSEVFIMHQGAGACDSACRAANPSGDLSVAKSDFNCSNLILSGVYMVLRHNFPKNLCQMSSMSDSIEWLCALQKQNIVKSISAGIMSKRCEDGVSQPIKMGNFQHTSITFPLVMLCFQLTLRLVSWFKTQMQIGRGTTNTMRCVAGTFDAHMHTWDWK